MLCGCFVDIQAVPSKTSVNKIQYIVLFFSPHQADADEDGTSQVLCRTHRISKILYVGGQEV